MFSPLQYPYEQSGARALSENIGFDSRNIQATGILDAIKGIGNFIRRRRVGVTAAIAAGAGIVAAAAAVKGLMDVSVYGTFKEMAGGVIGTMRSAPEKATTNGDSIARLVSGVTAGASFVCAGTSLALKRGMELGNEPKTDDGMSLSIFSPNAAERLAIARAEIEARSARAEEQAELLDDIMYTFDGQLPQATSKIYYGNQGREGVAALLPDPLPTVAKTGITYDFDGELHQLFADAPTEDLSRLATLQLPVVSQF